ncbi:MAG: spore germination protein GerW family protein, partial [Thermotogota bacterium]|nr:spore germination protein GerW family protein [Thermotogota bacterium]
KRRYNMKKLYPFFIVLLLLTTILTAKSVSDVPGMILGSGFETITPNMAIGDPVEVGDKYLIPVFEVNTFFLGAGGGEPLIAAGTSGSVNLIPYSIIIVSGDDIEIRSLSNKEPLLKQIVDVLPQILQMVMQYFSVAPGSVQSGVIEKEIKPTPMKEEQAVTEKKEPLNEQQIIQKSTESLSRMLMNDPAMETIEGSRSEIQGLLQKQPENSRLLGLYAYTTLRMIDTVSPLEQMKMAMEAQKTINKGLTLDPNDYFLNLSNGWLNLYSPMGNMEASVNGFKQAIEASPDQLEPYFGIVEAYLKTGNREKAEEYAQKGKQMSPEATEEFNQLLNK